MAHRAERNRLAHALNGNMSVGVLCHRFHSCFSEIFVEILCFVGRLSLNSLIVCAITVREEPKLHVSPTSETSQT